MRWWVGLVFRGVPALAVLALLLAAAALVVLLHVRSRRRRRQLFVSSDELWTSLPATEVVAASAPSWRRRWREILTVALLLHLLAVMALVVAAGDPHPSAGLSGPRLAVLVDTSASMGALGPAGTRLDEARSQVALRLEQLAPGEQATVIEFSERAFPAIGWTDERPRLNAALADLQTRQERGDVRQAFRLVRQQAQAQGGGHTRTVVLSDQPRAAIDKAAAELLPGMELEVVTVGQPANNIAIRGFTVERAPEDESRLEAEVTVSNFGPRAVRARLAIRALGGSASVPAGDPLASAELAVPAGGTASARLTLQAQTEISLEARLESPQLGEDNSLAIDDTALVVVPRSSRRRLLVVGGRNLYLDGALLSFGGELRVERASPAEAEGRRSGWGDYDVVIFDGWTPEQAPSQGRFLFIAPPSGSAAFQQSGQMLNPVPGQVMREHPLVRQLSLGDLNIKRAARLVAEPGDEVPVAAAGGPLVITRARGPLRLVGLAFDPRLSDLPLRPAFPLLLANAFDWLAGPVGRGMSRRIDSPGVGDSTELDTRTTGGAVAVPASPARRALRATRSELAVWLLVLAALLVLADWIRRARTGAPDAPLTLALRAAALAAVIAGILGPTLQRSTRQLAVHVLVDRSDSVAAGERRTQPAGLSSLQADAARAGTRFTSSAFQHSDLGTALAEGLLWLPPDRLGRLLLLSDGRDSGGWVRTAGIRIAAREVAVFTSALPSRPPTDPRLNAVRAAGDVREGSLFDLESEIEARGPGAAALMVTPLVSGQSRSQPVNLVPGLNLVRIPLLLDQPEMVFRVELQSSAGAPKAPPGGSPREQAVLAVAGQPRPRVLVLESPGACLPLRKVLSAEKMLVDTAARGVPPPERLRLYDLVVLCDVPRRALGPRGERDLATFVTEGGGGLLMTGGPEGWGGGDYQSSSLDRLLPLEHEPPARKEEATAALALVIDRSGSMSGPKIDLAKEAARASAALMNPLDLLTVVAFDSQASTIVRLQPAGNRQRILGDIGGLRSGGGTNILAGLREAVAELQSADARRKHIILLSDGQSPTEGVSDLVEEAVSARITVSAVGVGDGADLPLLQLIASRGGGRFHRTRDPASLPRIFTRETAEVTSSTEDPRGSRVRAAASAEALRDVPLASAPPLFGHSRARERGRAEVLLRSDRGSPLLARWQQGVGQVMVFAGDFSARWSGEWLVWRHFGTLWAQLARSTMLRGGARSLPLQARLEGQEVVVTVRAHDPGDRPRRGLLGVLSVREVDASGRLQPGEAASKLDLLEPSPGVYEARFAVAAQPAALLFQADFHDARLSTASGRPGWQARGQVALWPPLERRVAAGPSGPALLASIAQQTGGRVLGADPAAVLSPAGPDRSARRTVPLRPWLALIALVLFVADIASRRANFRAPGHSLDTSGRGAAW